MDTINFYIAIRRLTTHFGNAYSKEDFNELRKIFFPFPDDLITEFVEYAKSHYAKLPKIEYVKSWLKEKTTKKNSSIIDVFENIPDKSEFGKFCIRLLNAKLNGEISNNEFYAVLNSLEKKIPKTTNSCTCTDGLMWFENRLYACRNCPRGQLISNTTLKWIEKNGETIEKKIPYAPYSMT